MNKAEAIAKLEILIERAEPLKFQPRNGQEFLRWNRDTSVAIKNIFGEKTSHIDDFGNIMYELPAYVHITPEIEFQNYYVQAIEKAITIIRSMRDEVEEYWSCYNSQKKSEVLPHEQIILIINRFHQVCRQLSHRYSNRHTLNINDEYDVQDLFHALLKLYFDDVRAEEYVPSYAGGNSRTDFILKKEQIIIEIKKSRPTLKAKEVGEQLIIDSHRYQAHPDCKRIICFVYDPEGYIVNPKGIENDLSKNVEGIPVTVLIRPKVM